MRKIVRDNGLLLANLGLFLLFLVAMALTGVRAYNADQVEHHQSTLSLLNYIGTGNFIESVFENWESEFLQMGLYVVLTAFLRQKGSAESKKLEGDEAVDEDPRRARGREDAPWPVRRGGPILVLYEHSLSLALFVLFILSLV